MKHKTNASIILALVLMFVFIACNNEKKEETAKTDVVKTENPSIPAYDAAMDPMTVEAAFITQKFADTLGIKFYEVTIKPGDSVAMHTHPDHLIYVKEGAMAIITSKGGSPQSVDFKTGMGIITGPDTHVGKNVGTTNLRLLVADIYRPRN